MTDLDIILGILSVAAWVAGASLLGIGIGKFIIWGAKKEKEGDK